MTRDYLAAHARRVLVGLDDEGRSTIVSDAPTEARLATAAFTRNLIWGGDVVPTPVMAENAVEDAGTIPPPPSGYYYDISTFPPDSEWDFEAGYAQALAEAGVDGPAGGEAGSGMDHTHPNDVVPLISGGIWGGGG